MTGCIEAVAILASRALVPQCQKTLESAKTLQANLLDIVAMGKATPEVHEALAALRETCEMLEEYIEDYGGDGLAALIAHSKTTTAPTDTE